MQIYLLQDGEKRGPLTIYEVAEQVRSGKAGEDTLGWHQGSEGWLRLDELPPTSSIFVDPPPRPEVVKAEEVAEQRARLAPERARASVRLWARVIDMFLLGFVVSMVAITTGLMSVTELYLNPRIEIALMPGVLQMLLEGVMIHVFGVTPGKWLLRVRVEREGGGQIPLGTSFRRAFTVWWRGTGFWLFPLYILTMVIAQTNLLSTGKTPWDRACELKISYGKVDRNRVFFIIGLVFCLVMTMQYAFGEELLEAMEAAREK